MELTRDNYELYFLSYIDNELSPAERRAVEVFVEANPDLGAELALLQRTVLTDDAPLVFENKALLYREAATPAMVVPLWLRRGMAAAAAVAIIATAAWLWYEPAKEKGPINIAALPKRDSNQQMQPETTALGNSRATPETPAAGTNDATGNATTDASQQNNPAGATNGDRTPTSATTVAKTPEAQPSATTATNNNNITAAQNTVTSTATQDLTVKASTERLDNAPGTDGALPTRAEVSASEKNTANAVTTATPVTYHTLEDNDEEKGNKVLFVNTDEVANGGVKSFFRKAGRLIKRNTSL